MSDSFLLWVSILNISIPIIIIYLDYCHKKGLRQIEEEFKAYQDEKRREEEHLASILRMKVWGEFLKTGTKGHKCN